MKTVDASSFYDKIALELTEFCTNPAADVGRIMTLVQAMKVPGKDIAAVVQKIYITHYQAVVVNAANKARQSWVSASGNRFEEFLPCARGLASQPVRTGRSRLLLPRPFNDRRGVPLRRRIRPEEVTTPRAMSWISLVISIAMLPFVGPLALAGLPVGAAGLDP